MLKQRDGERKEDAVAGQRRAEGKEEAGDVEKKRISWMAPFFLDLLSFASIQITWRCWRRGLTVPDS